MAQEAASAFCEAGETFCFGKNIAMTRSHLFSLYARFSRVHVPVEVLSPSGEDLADPIGGDRQVYEECADQISAYLRERLAALQP